MEEEKVEEEENLRNLMMYDSVLEDGIFNMVITLCQHKANTIPMQQAKLDVAAWLEKVINGLSE